MLSTSVSEYRDIREIEKGRREGLPPTVYMNTWILIKTDRKNLNIEGEWGQGGDRLLSTSVSEYRDIREIEKGERVGLSPSVSEYIDIKTDRKSLNI